MTLILIKIIKVIDTINERLGTLFAWLIIPLVVSLVYEVFARYLFRAPTVWAYDMSYMLYGSLFMLGAAYTLLKKGHIRTDLLYKGWSPRWQGIVDATLYLFFLLVLFFVLKSTWQSSFYSWTIREVAWTSAWRPPIYPFKFGAAIALSLLFVQGISELLKSLLAVFKGKWL